MAEKKTFIGDVRDLDVYRKALVFSNKIYKIIERLPAYERNNLSDQMRRSSTSIYANISEGNSNYYYRKEIDRLNTALASTAETRSYLDFCIMQKYITRAEYEKLDRDAEEIFKMLIAMINRLEKILKEEAS
ncbi:four helix bundle protein [Bacillus rubiinfantis]|uniref:four helix bundle protein n=1 Tax=Bacillus rubiinfantis TaxID=1499680 RepID=UPI0005A9AF95|nr:four helix bundle protein [Bacillus rubiinfantis]